MYRRWICLVSLVVVLCMATGTTKAELVGWWRFDEGSGTIANDSSGNGNDATAIQHAPCALAEERLDGSLLTLQPSKE